MGSRNRVIGLVGALAIAAAPAARADIVVEGTKWVEARLEISAGRYADWCERSHVVAEGETIESIARAAFGDEARVAEVRRGNALPADGQPKPGTRLVLPAKSAEPADAAEPHAWEFWLVLYCDGLGAAWQMRSGEGMKAPHTYFTLLALPVARSADFAKLRRERPEAPIDDKLEAELPWLVVSRGHLSGKVVDSESKAVRNVTTCTFDEVRPAPLVDKRWTFVRTLDYFDAGGKKVPGGLSGGFIDVGRAWPLIALSFLGALLLGVLRRRRAEPRRWRWLAPAVAALLLAPAARADVLFEGQKSVSSSARLVLDATATASGAPAWELWRVGDGGLGNAKRIAAGEALARDSSWGFRVLALPADRAADFEALRKERARERLDGTWDASVPWLVVSASIDLPKSVDEASPVAKIVTTYALAAADPATNGGKEWRIAEASVEPFDASGVALTEAHARGGSRSGMVVPLVMVSVIGVIAAARRRRVKPHAA